MMLIAKVMMWMLIFLRKELLAASVALVWGSRGLKSTAWSRASLNWRTEAEEHRVVSKVGQRSLVGRRLRSTA